MDATYVCPVCEKRLTSIFEAVSSIHDQFAHDDDHSVCPGSIEFFKDHINKEGERGHLPLRCIVRSYHMGNSFMDKGIEGAVRILLENGADPHYVGEVGLSKNISSAYNCAQKRKMTKIIEIFEECFMIKEPDCDE